MVTALREATRATYRPNTSSDSPFWAALVTDTNLGVVVVTDDGVVEFINPAAARVIGKSPDEIIGNTYSSFFDTEYAKERLSVMKDVLTSNECICVDGLVRGKFLRSTYRPLGAAPGGRPRVLIVARPAVGLSPKDEIPACRILKAKVNDAGALAALTTRELEIMRLIGLGLSTADIAKKLHRSVKTIEWHRVSLGTKLGVKNRVELARLAISAGMVGLDSQANGRGIGD